MFEYRMGVRRGVLRFGGQREGLRRYDGPEAWVFFLEKGRRRCQREERDAKGRDGYDGPTTWCFFLGKGRGGWHPGKPDAKVPAGTGGLHPEVLGEGKGGGCRVSRVPSK